jgi:hypothetical protein
MRFGFEEECREHENTCASGNVIEIKINVDAPFSIAACNAVLKGNLRLTDPIVDLRKGDVVTITPNNNCENIMIKQLI